MLNSQPIEQNHQDHNRQYHSDMRRFLSMRGVLLMKEFKDIGAIRTQHYKKISLSTVILSATSPNNQVANTSFGAKFEEIDEDGDTAGNAFIDFDEIDDFISGLYFLENASKQMATQQRDYTEIIYSTKDDVKYGFFQSNGSQQAFINIKGYGDVVFLSFPQLFSLRNWMMDAKRHLSGRGAKQVIQQMPN